jgi:riboflavin biosynthesis pyrimidine reductase
VGAGTVRAEEYRPSRLPIAIVSSRLDLDPTSPLLAEAEHPTIVLTVASAGADRISALAAAPSTEVVVCGETHVDLSIALANLRGRGLSHVLCEGGPTLLGALAAADLLDELCVTLSPLLAGSGGRTGLLQGPPLPELLPLGLTQLLEDDGTLFARYRVGR